MKETFYFSHDYHARHDLKLTDIQMKYGMEGVGIYWCLVEMLYEQDGKIPLENVERIAFELRTNKERITDVLRTELFKCDATHFWSNSVLSRLAERRDKSNKAKESIKARWSKKNTNVLRTKYECNTIKESKVKEIKEKEPIIEFGDYVKLTKKQYDALIADYGVGLVELNIEKVNNYCESSGKKYTGWAAAIRNFIKLPSRVTVQKMSDKDLVALMKTNLGLEPYLQKIDPHRLFAIKNS